MNRRKLIEAIALMLIVTPAATETREASELKDIMAGLRDNLVEISDGLLTDNFEQVAKGADSIAQHPKIPAAQVQLVATELGSEMAAFKQLDTLVHDLSLEVGAAAAANDRDTAIAAYQRLIEGCLECHSAYKERVASVLN